MNYSQKLFMGMVLLLAICLPAKAQTLRDYIRSRAESSDSLLIKAITPSLSIIRQQYRLERNGEFFGKNNKSYYGETYSLGVKVAGATSLQNQAARPWENDKDYKRINQSSNYNPSLFWSFQRSLNDSVYNMIEWDYDHPIDKDSSIYRSEDAIRDFGLSIDIKSGQKSGYLVWVYSTSNLQDSAMHVLIRQTYYQVAASVENADIAMTPNESEKIIGGLYVVPVYESGGRIQMTVAGVASKSTDDKWILHLLTIETPKEHDTKSSTVQEKKSSKKRHEDESSKDEPTPVG